jgi:hypothetical protein
MTDHIDATLAMPKQSLPVIFKSGDIVTTGNGKQWYRLGQVRDQCYAVFTPIRRDGERDRRWDVGFSGSLNGFRLVLPVAPACATLQGALSYAPHTSSLAPVPFSESDGQARFRKEIVRDGQNGDFLMLLNNEPVGFARNYSEADTTLDELIFAIRFESDTPGTDCPSCGDLLCEDAAVCTACRESGEGI